MHVQCPLIVTSYSLFTWPVLCSMQFVVIEPIEKTAKSKKSAVIYEFAKMTKFSFGDDFWWLWFHCVCHIVYKMCQMHTLAGVTTHSGLPNFFRRTSTI